ncbi:MAG: hypothetical protein RhofKO_33130 [Rhodothermales bacterium]
MPLLLRDELEERPTLPLLRLLEREEPTPLRLLERLLLRVAELLLPEREELRFTPLRLLERLDELPTVLRVRPLLRLTPLLRVPEDERVTPELRLPPRTVPRFRSPRTPERVPLLTARVPPERTPFRPVDMVLRVPVPATVPVRERSPLTTFRPMVLPRGA